MREPTTQSTNSAGAASDRPEPRRADGEADGAGIVVDRIPPGTTLGRFVVQAALGAGGAAVVYAAHDPDLDRTVALKVLRHEIAEHAGAGARFLREAQSLARVTHPNVISVYDVGTAFGRAFIAMEYIRGQTFRDWLTQVRRPWREVVAILIKAGRGLAAAHAAGIIHRDFKPANLLVGEDGRVVVTDFGLARAPRLGSDHTEPAESAASPRVASLTRSGAVQGTPAYMAPEQRYGRPTDERADQFSFCVTLYEAVFGVHPFALLRLADATAPATASAFTVRIPDNARGAPAWLQRAVLRGLAERPGDRFPHMDALLAALHQQPLRRRRIRRAIAGAIVVATAAAALYALPDRSAAALCTGAADKLAPAWSPASRAAMREAFAATGSPLAADTWRRVDTVLDSYASRWAAMHTEACVATRLRGEQSEATMDRRMACLDGRRNDLEQLVQLLRKPDSELVERAVTAAYKLSDLGACGDLAALGRAVAAPSDPATAARVRALRERIAELRALNNAGKLADGLAAATRLAGDPVGRDYLPVRAELAYWTAKLRASHSDWAEALPPIEDAIWAAEASGHDELALLALAQAVEILAKLDRGKDAHAMARRGEAAVLRTSAPPLPHAELLRATAVLALKEGKFADMRDAAQQMLALRRRELAPEHPDVAAALTSVGLAIGHGGDHVAAFPYLQQALAILEKANGPDHPAVAQMLNNLGMAEYRHGRPDDAVRDYRRALAIYDRALGPDSPASEPVLVNLGNMLRRRERYGEATLVLQRALAIATRKLGPRHSEVATVQIALAEVRNAQNDHAGALAHLHEAAAIVEATLGPAHPRFGEVQVSLCATELDRGRLREALPLCLRGLAVLEASYGRDHSRVADMVVGTIARSYAANGRIAEALAAFDRALARWPKDDPLAPSRIAGGELALAQTIWDRAPGERSRARALAVRARDRLLGARAGHGAELADVTAWLARHGGPAPGRLGTTRRS